LNHQEFSTSTVWLTERGLGFQTHPVSWQLENASWLLSNGLLSATLKTDEGACSFYERDQSADFRTPSQHNFCDTL